jgi:hypothetical protein
MTDWTQLLETLDVPLYTGGRDPQLRAQSLSGLPLREGSPQYLRGRGESDLVSSVAHTAEEVAQLESALNMAPNTRRLLYNRGVTHALSPPGREEWEVHGLDDPGRRAAGSFLPGSGVAVTEEAANHGTVLHEMMHALSFSVVRTQEGMLRLSEHPAIVEAYERDLIYVQERGYLHRGLRSDGREVAALSVAPGYLEYGGSLLPGGGGSVTGIPAGKVVSHYLPASAGGTYDDMARAREEAFAEIASELVLTRGTNQSEMEYYFPHMAAEIGEILSAIEGRNLRSPLVEMLGLPVLRADEADLAAAAPESGLSTGISGVTEPAGRGH